MNDSNTYKITCHFLGTTNYFVSSFERYFLSNVAAAVVNGALIFSTIFLNAVSIITILKSSQLKSKPCYYIILIQSVIDLAVGVFVIPLHLLYLVQVITGSSNCFGTFLVLKSITLPLVASTITLSAMTLERYVAILHPYAYTTQVTEKRILSYVGFGTTVTIFVIVLSIRIQVIIGMFAVLLVSLTFLFIVFAYTRIYMVVRRLRHSPSKSSDVETEKNLSRKKLLLLEIKQAKSCFIIVICFFILSFLPPVIFTFFLHRSKDEEKLRAAQSWIYTIAILNSSANSVIFFWTKTFLRKEAKKRLELFKT